MEFLRRFPTLGSCSHRLPPGKRCSHRGSKERRPRWGKCCNSRPAGNPTRPNAATISMKCSTIARRCAVRRNLWRRCRSPKGSSGKRMRCCCAGCGARGSLRAHTGAPPTGSARPAAPWTRHGSCRSRRTGSPKPWMRGSATSMRTRPTSWCNWPSFMPNSKPCTHFWTATGAWGACSCRYSFGRPALSARAHVLHQRLFRGAPGRLL